MISDAEKKKLEYDLNKCQTVGEVFEYLVQTYQVEQTKLTPITKPLMVKGLIQAIQFTNPRKR